MSGSRVATLFTVLAAGLSLGCPPQDTRTREIVERATAGRGAYATLAHLTDRIGPRLSGSDGLEKAVAWTKGELETAGLDGVHTEKVMVPHWIRGVETGRLVAPVDRPLALTALGGSIATPPGGIEAEVIEASSFDELKAAGDRVKGKIVLYNKPILPNSEDHGYGSAVKLRTEGASEAARLGGVGSMVRSLGTASFRIPHTGAMRYKDDAPKVPAAAISAEDAELVHRLISSGEPVRVRFTLGCETLPDAESANVVADLRGREPGGEIVLIGAHLDSWDLATGAIDDGAGVAIVMESMRVLKSLGAVPRRTIRAVLFTNEENGLKGGKGYAADHQGDWARHVAAIESDSGGGRPKGFTVKAGEGGVEMIERLFPGLSGSPDFDIKKGGGGADIGPLLAGGVPQIGLRQDGTHYFDWHHSPADTLDKIDPEELSLNVAAMAALAWELAEAPGTLPRPAPEVDAEETAPAKPAVK